MPYYAVQRHKTTCGPTAIINVGKWAGNKLSMKHDYKRICKETLCDSTGTSNIDIDRVLHKELGNFLIIRKFNEEDPPSYFKMCSHIRKGGAALLSYPFVDKNPKIKELLWHIVLIDSVDEDGNCNVQNMEGFINKFVDSPTILSFFYGNGYPVMWLLTKNNKS